MARIPALRTPLIGRESQRAFVRNALLHQDVRLLTLTGFGGVGKTHLALALTAELELEFADGAHFISLEQVRHPDLVLEAIARAVGIQDLGNSPIAERLRAKLASAKLLFTLDNLEQVASIAPELTQLLEAAPEVRILATSRTPLQVSGEFVLPVPPLQVPDSVRPPPLDELRENEAVELLVQRARATDPTFALTEDNATEIAEICVRLEGLPLAIELAAARLQVLSPSALLDRLSKPLSVLTRGDARLPPRQQTLRSTIAWSEQLLSPIGQTIFQCLSVFAGGCDAATAEAICGDQPGNTTPSCKVLDALAELLEHGLLQREVVGGTPRFIMPHTICEYAREVLKASGEDEPKHRRHAAYFLALAEDAASALKTSDLEEWLELLDREHPNFRVALEWSLDQDPGIALRLTAALWRFWYLRGYMREGRSWLERTIATRAGERSAERVRSLNGLGVLVWVAGDLERARDLQHKSLCLAREISDAWGIAAAQGDRAIVEYMMGGGADQAREATEDVLDQFRSLGDRYSEGVALNALGTIALSEGKLAEATGRFQEALVVARELGHSRGEALCLSNLAQLARLEGNLDRSQSFSREGLSIAHRLGNQEDLLYCLAGIGGIAAERRQFVRAAQLLGAAAAIADTLGMTLQPLEQAQFDHDVGVTRAGLSDAAFQQAWATGRLLPLNEAVAEASQDTGSLDQLQNGHGPTGDLNSEPTLADGLAQEYGLSRRELEVLRLLAAGSSDRQIADALFISDDTASTHVKHIRQKLGVHSRSAAAAFAIRHGLA
jgi:non-specific serine/threonine protein kinase